MKSIGILTCLFCAFLMISGCDEETIDQPSLVLSTNVLTFTNDEPQSVYISTNPATDAVYEVISSPDWVHVYPKEGEITRNIQEIVVDPREDLTLFGILTGKMVIMSSLGSDTVTIKGYFGFYSYDTLRFSFYENQKSITIFNPSDQESVFNLKSINSYVKPEITSGIIPANGEVTVLVNAVRTSMSTGTYESTVDIEVNDKWSVIPVVIEHFEEEKLILETDVVDAAFIREENLLVYVSANPMRFTLYYPKSGGMLPFNLTYVPTCLSVSPDGNYAVVGHDGRLTYIDIENRQVLKVIDVPCYISDIVIAGNGWAYAVPEQGTHVKLQCVDLAAGTVTDSQGNSIYDGSRIKLHPSGKYLYLADRGVSPADLRKMDIQGGVAVYMYDSPYHGDYPSGENLWITQLGERIITQGKSVFKTSELQSQDMLYNGKITLESTGTYSYSHIKWLDHHEGKDRLYIIASGEDWDAPNQPYVFIHNATNLVYSEKVATEPYLVPSGQGQGTFFEATPHWVFSNNSGDKILVITKALESGLVNEWAVQELVVQ